MPKYLYKEGETKYIARIVDDYALPNRLEMQLNYLKNNLDLKVHQPMKIKIQTNTL